MSFKTIDPILGKNCATRAKKIDTSFSKKWLPAGSSMIVSAAGHACTLEKHMYHAYKAHIKHVKILNINLPRVVQFRLCRKKSIELRADRKCRVSCTYDDFREFMKTNPSLMPSAGCTKPSGLMFTGNFSRPVSRQRDEIFKSGSP